MSEPHKNSSPPVHDVCVMCERTGRIGGLHVEILTLVTQNTAVPQSVDRFSQRDHSNSTKRMHVHTSIFLFINEMIRVPSDGLLLLPPPLILLL